MAIRFGLVLVFACFGAGFCRREPTDSCTRIDFEEKMLQKMVLLDHTVKTTLASVNAKLDEFASEKVKLLKEIENFKVGQKEEFGAFKVAADDTIAQQTTQQEQFMKEMTSKYDTMVTQTDGRVQQIEADVLNTTDTLKKTAGQDPVAFIARFSTDTTPVADSALKFNVVVLNVGDAYDTSDGTFTAPVTGTYTFSQCTDQPVPDRTLSKKLALEEVCIQYDQHIFYSIQSKTTVYGRSKHAEKVIDDTCSSMSIVSILAAGEEVWVQCTSMSASSQILESNSNVYWSMFSGALVRPSS